MAKGFSTLELATIITCASIAIHGATKDKPVNFASMFSQVNSAYAHKDVFSANKYLRHVGNRLQQINNG